MEDLISVIIPAYNIEQYLAKTLRSVLDQTYRNLEIIIVNDGSRDGTGDVIRAYEQKDPRIRGIHQENAGVTTARLRGLAEATGDYIGFVDGDDFLEPDMYQRLMNNLKTYDADISHCGYQMIFLDGRVRYFHNTGELRLQEGQQSCLDLLDGMVTEPGLWNKLYRRELFEGLADWMDPSIRITEDLLMNFYLFRRARRCVLEDVCLYRYIRREESATMKKINSHQLEDPLKVLLRLDELTAEVPLWNQAVERRLMYRMVVSATMSVGAQKDLIRPFRKQVRKELRKRLWKTLKGDACGNNLKLKALWAAIWPASYNLAHRIYAKVTGSF